MNVRDYVFRGTTRSLCPHCRRVVDAKIVVRDRRVYFRKRCPEHGLVEDFVCSDVAYWDRNEHAQPARTPRTYGVAPDKGCPLDCGLCTEHEQHTCIALVEVTTGCNLKCPTCFGPTRRGSFAGWSPPPGICGRGWGQGKVTFRSAIVPRNAAPLLE